MSHPGSSPQTLGKQREKKKKTKKIKHSRCFLAAVAMATRLTSPSLFPSFFLLFSLSLSVCRFFACFVSLFQSTSPSLLFFHTYTHSQDPHFIVKNKTKHKYQRRNESCIDFSSDPLNKIVSSCYP